MKMCIKKVLIGFNLKWVGVMIGKGGYLVFLIGEVRNWNELSEELKVLVVVVSEVV